MSDEEPFLQKQREGTAAFAQAWTLDNIRAGFEHFRKIHGHYPTAKEIETFEYLPSPRSIQRSHGGLVKLRQQLGISGPSDFTRGEARASVARTADVRARKYEEEFFAYLASRLPEQSIHEHKVIRPGGVSSDFYIYTGNRSGIVIDLFYAADIKILSKILSIKQKRYSLVIEPIYFISVGNEAIAQSAIDAMVLKKSIPLPVSMRVFTESHFKDNFDQLVPSVG